MSKKSKKHNNRKNKSVNKKINNNAAPINSKLIETSKLQTQEEKLDEKILNQPNAEQIPLKKEEVPVANIAEDAVAEKDKKRRFKPIYIGTITSIALIVLSSLAISTLMLTIQPLMGFGDVWHYIIKSNYLVLILNTLPVLLTMLLVFFVTNSFIISCGLISFISITIATINRYKIIFRQDPFMPWDVLLGGEVLEISKGFDKSTFSWLPIFAVMFLALAFVVIAFIFIKNKKIYPYVRVALIITTIFFIKFSNQKLYKNKTMFKEMYISGDMYNQVDVFNSKGFLYCFIYSFNTGKIVKPANYSSKEFKDLQNNLSLNNEKVKPHIFLILSEAFSELSNSESVEFIWHPNPLENYTEIKKESISGYILPPGFGGGTADTEFDILTGVNTRHFRGVPYSNLLITNRFKSFASNLKDLGYKSVAIHPGTSWFYNRNNVLKHLGFDKFIDISYFNENDKKGFYINDKVTFERIKYEFEQHLQQNPNVPLLNFCITIQNHGPYMQKYVYDMTFDAKTEFKEDDINELSNYFEGVKDADRELGSFVNYLKETNEPCVLIYFGDHAPYLSTTAYETLYKNIDLTTQEGKLQQLKCPFLIWQNDAAKNMNVLKTEQLEQNFFSSFYLGATVLELLGYAENDPFFNSILELKQNYPVILEEQYLDKNYNINTLKDENGTENEDIAHYKRFEYYRIFDDK